MNIARRLWHGAKPGWTLNRRQARGSNPTPADVHLPVATDSAPLRNPSTRTADSPLGGPGKWRKGKLGTGVEVWCGPLPPLGEGWQTPATPLTPCDPDFQGSQPSQLVQKGEAAVAGHRTRKGVRKGRRAAAVDAAANKGASSQLQTPQATTDGVVVGPPPIDLTDTQPTPSAVVAGSDGSLEFSDSVSENSCKKNESSVGEVGRSSPEIIERSEVGPAPLLPPRRKGERSRRSPRPLSRSPSPVSRFFSPSPPPLSSPPPGDLPFSAPPSPATTHGGRVDTFSSQVAVGRFLAESQAQVSVSQAETVIEADDELASTPSVLLMPATVDDARLVVRAADIPNREVTRARHVADRVVGAGVGRRQQCG